MGSAKRIKRSKDILKNIMQTKPAFSGQPQRSAGWVEAQEGFLDLGPRPREARAPGTWGAFQKGNILNPRQALKTESKDA
jgi:hypothetical protein